MPNGYLKDLDRLKSVFEPNMSAISSRGLFLLLLLRRLPPLSELDCRGIALFMLDVVAVLVIVVPGKRARMEADSFLVVVGPEIVAVRWAIAVAQGTIRGRGRRRPVVGNDHFGAMVRGGGRRRGVGWLAVVVSRPGFVRRRWSVKEEEGGR